MHKYHILLKVFTIICLPLLSTSQFLFFKDIIEFNEIKQYRFNPQASIRMNDKSKFTMRRVFPDKNSVALEINYKMDKRTILAKKTEDGFAWIYTDKSNPYKVLSYTITKKTPQDLKQLVLSMSTTEIKGLDNILAVLNQIEWTPDLIKHFYKKSAFSVLRASTKDDFGKEMKILKDMMNFLNKFNPGDFDFDAVRSFLVSMNMGSVYPNDIKQYIMDIFIRIFYEQLNRKSFHFDHFSKNKEDFYTYMPDDFVFSFEDLDALRTLVDEEIDLVSDELKDVLQNEVFPSKDDIMKIYDQILLPMTENKLFPLYPLLFQKIKRSEMTRKTQAEVAYLYAKFDLNTVFTKKEKMFEENLVDLTTGMITETLRMYGPSNTNYPLLSNKLVYIFKRLKTKVLNQLKNFKNLNFQNAWRLFLMHEGDFYKNYVNIAPDQFCLSSYLGNQLFKHFDNFIESDLLTRIMGPDYDPYFLKKNIYYASLLGGDFPGRPRYVNELPVFKLKVTRKQPAMELILI